MHRPAPERPEVFPTRRVVCHKVGISQINRTVRRRMACRGHRASLASVVGGSRCLMAADTLPLSGLLFSERPTHGVAPDLGDSASQRRRGLSGVASHR